MTTKHTPGPWILAGESGTYAPVAAPHGTLAAVRYLGSSPERVREEQANARLIAAAPDMLAALQEVRDAILDILNGGDLRSLSVVALDAVIDKATKE
jgi:hypothetical protein